MISSLGFNVDKLFPFTKNIYNYLHKSKGFILSSLWEDPGFVLIEASYCRAPVLSSNSWPGPVEIIKHNLVFSKKSKL